MNKIYGILITGGAGFIASNFIHYWLAKHPKDEIVNYDALTYAGNLENLQELKDKKNLREHRVDTLLNTDKLKKWLWIA